MIKGKKLYWLFQLSGWCAFLLWSIFSAWSFERFSTLDQRVLVIKRAAVFFLLGILMTHFIRLVIIKWKILDKKLSSQIGLLAVAIILTSFIAGVLELITNTRLNALTLGEKAMVDKSLPLILTNNASGWLILFIAWNAIYFTYHYIITSQKEQIDNLKLKSHIKELELKTIKSHINPHFIFNALNSIRAMVEENPQRARRAITELSNILRSSINIDKHETVVLEDELNIIKDYLALEQMRFDERLVVEYTINEQTRWQQVPPMMLQMLVENAIKHGINHEVSGGVVKLTALTDKNLIILTVENTGKLKKQQHTRGFGIKSVQQRLRLMYGDNASIELIQATPNSVMATLQLPITI